MIIFGHLQIGVGSVFLGGWITEGERWMVAVAVWLIALGIMAVLQGSMKL